MKEDIALKVFDRICEAWTLDEEEREKLAGSPPSLERISYVFGIYKALRTIFPTERQAADWIRKKNWVFDGKTALEAMIDEPAVVRRYLDAQLL
ncbi:Protein of unknown function [Marinobacter segnicrescens]|uniref:Antitoxin Xre/MbcA/ParS-like toxin-binding domain-containing protein n=1 Tax=Marinobacter segnicrescens TaxID=430453 RepID=A0A1I0H7D7_9GAMM|nr:MbcA/ParS/Xre antitoxin family protein [Marinobacter segnicrescens]SET79569.1 Protein of unknown function [Marinobacter segnicrescens]